jgi:FtsH-binding integral membrane protein
MSYGLEHDLAARATASVRAAFIRRTYAHLAGAVLALIGLVTVLLNVVDQQAVLNLMFGGRFSWLIVMLAFMGAGWLAQVWASSETSVGLQYLGLALYIVAWAIMFLPLIIVATYVDPNTIPTAGIMTGAVFGGLTLSVFVMRKDFSFLAPILSVGMMIALGVIVAAILFGFSLGLLFSFAMVALISGYILYDTSNVMLRYNTNQHVAAALALFADVALLFWYILRILMMSSSRN